MDILAAIRREKRKLENQLGKLQRQLNGVRAAAKALGHSASREVSKVKSASCQRRRERRYRKPRRPGGRNSGRKKPRRANHKDSGCTAYPPQASPMTVLPANFRSKKFS
jgi:hypothetical protein